jgi:hypothetical protein
MADVENLQDRSDRLLSGPRLAELDRLAATLEQELVTPADGTFAALSMLLTDAILDWDEAAVGRALEHLQRLAAAGRAEGVDAARTEGRLLSLIDVAHSGMQRALPSEFMGHVEPGSNSHRFLKQIEREPLSPNLALSVELDVEESEVSRIGRRLVQTGLARKRRLGRTNQWLITPRGIQVLGVLEAGGVNRPTREHRQLQT